MSIVKPTASAHASKAYLEAMQAALEGLTPITRQPVAKKAAEPQARPKPSHIAALTPTALRAPSSNKRKRTEVPGSSDEDELTAPPSQLSTDRPRSSTAQAIQHNSVSHTPTETATVKKPSTHAPSPLKNQAHTSAHGPPSDPVISGRYAVTYLSKRSSQTLCTACCKRKIKVLQTSPRKTIRQPVLDKNGQGLIHAGQLILTRTSNEYSKYPGKIRYWHFMCLTSDHLRQLKREWGRAGKRLPAPEYFRGFDKLRNKDKHFVFQSIRQCKLVEDIG